MTKLDQRKIYLNGSERPLEEIVLWLEFLTKHNKFEKVQLTVQDWKVSKLLSLGRYSDIIEVTENYSGKCPSVSDSFTLITKTDLTQTSNCFFWSLGGAIKCEARMNFVDFLYLDGMTENNTYNWCSSSVNFCFYQKINFFRLILSGKMYFSDLKVNVRLIFINIILYFLRAFLLLVHQPKKNRTYLSFNWRSAEFKNLSNWSGIRPLFLFLHPIIVPQKSFYFTLSANSAYQLLLSLVLDRYVHMHFCYIGLPGAKVVRDIVKRLNHNVTTIHVSHGRVTSPKFLEFTDYVFSRIKDNFNCRMIKLFSEGANFEWASVDVAWVHGYRKGSKYDIRNLLVDLKTLRHIWTDHPGQSIFVFVHPTAHLLRWVVSLISFFSFKLHCSKLSKKATYCVEVVYSSSPTFNRGIKAFDPVMQNSEKKIFYIDLLT